HGMPMSRGDHVFEFPAGCFIRYAADAPESERSESFQVRVPPNYIPSASPQQGTVTLSAGCVQLVPGSSWGTFTIACTIPIALFVLGVFLANPKLQCPTVNHTFRHGGPTFPGDIFPFLFICIMCGSVSGFHALVASGTTPKMIDRESHIRPIGYGAMLMEGLVGIVALITAASLPQDLYYDINTSLPEVPAYQERLDQ